MRRTALNEILVNTLLLFLVQTATAEVRVPVAVSPGSATGTQIGETCPTFSWGSVEKAGSYELVVYRLGEEGQEEQPILRQSFPGAVGSWTPSLDQCLEWGGRYAWAVRASGGKPTSWSEPAFFAVAAEPTEAELRRALTVVDRYLEGTGTRADVAKTSGEKAESRPIDAESTMVDSQYLPLPTGELTVDGTIVATDLTVLSNIEMYCGVGHRFSSNGHCYGQTFVRPGSTWAEAAESCEKWRHNSYLVTVTSPEEESFVRNLLVDDFALGSAWIGYSDVRSEGNWEWNTGELGVTDSNSVYSNWAPGEPNNLGDEDCAALIQGGWNDADCGSRSVEVYVCETDY